MKLKTHKAALKRVRVKKNILCRKKAYKAHLLKNKSSKRLRRLSEPNVIHISDRKAFGYMLPYA
jgi:ribosomal protein L35